MTTSSNATPRILGRTIRVGMRVALVFVIAGAGLWYLTTLPTLGKISPSRNAGASAEQLAQHVRALAQHMPPRTGRGLRFSQRYIADALSAYGVPRETCFGPNHNSFCNVAMRFGHRDAAPVLLGAHYDAHAGLPGADDNASGVAGVIELARLFHDHPTRLHADAAIELVAFPNEERPYWMTDLMGSLRYATDITPAPVVMISLEMLGYFSDAPGSQSYPVPWLKYLYGDRANFIAVVGRWQELAVVRTFKRGFRHGTQLPIRSLTFPPVIPGVGASDHASYWKLGHEAIMLTDTAYQRNPHYHTAGDRPETLDYPRMAEVINGVFEAALAIANGSP